MGSLTAEDQPICYINGKRYVLPPGKAEWTLLQYLRDLGLTGTKLGCGEGGCGACTVMLSSCSADGALLHRSVNACLCPLYFVEGHHVITVEGLGNSRQGLHPVQRELAHAHGSQCGFCTPGFVMSMYALLRSGKGRVPTEEEIEENLAGNLCRCTGYRPILEAFRVFAKTDSSAYTEEAIAASKGASGSTEASALNGTERSHTGQVCPSTGRPCDCGASSPADAACQPGQSSSQHGCAAAGSAAHARKKATCEPIFPHELRGRQAGELTIPGPVATWHRPISLAALLALKRVHPDARLVVGNSEVGIEMKFKDARYPHLVAATHVPELQRVQVTDAGLEVGASVTLSRFLALLRELVRERPAHKTSACAALAEQLRWFAGSQIRNMASVGGNIVTGSPISDLNPIYMAARAVFVVTGEGTGERQVAAQDFFLGYRRVALEPHEVLVAVRLPWTRRGEWVRAFKQARRRDDDIAIVNAGMRVLLQPGPQGTWEAAEAAIAYGGVAPRTVMAPAAQAALLGRPWGPEALQAALEAVREDVVIAPDAPGGMVEFRQSLVASFLFRFFVDVAFALEADSAAAYTAAFPPADRSALPLGAGLEQHQPVARGLQYYTADPAFQLLGHPHRHMAADLQVTGEAQYTDDMRLPPGTLYAALVLSSRPHARIRSIDPAPALQINGVAGFFGASDVPGGNDIGAVVHDEEVFATQLVTCVGQPLGVVVAESEAAARQGARAVAVQYEELPPVMSNEDAIAAESFLPGFPTEKRIDCGDVDGFFAGGSCEREVAGEVRIGGQEHFYLEPHCCSVVPGENDEYTLYSSTQAPAKHQATVAHVLGIPEHKVVCRVKRLGGGFGGKESRGVFLHAAIAVPAFWLRRPVRLCLDRDTDMAATGHRHAFHAKYRAGFDSNGRLQALDLRLFNNAGCSLDLSAAILERALLHCDNCYRVPHLRAVGRICRTNQPSNTAFRGFGGPQGMLVAEMILDRIARDVGQPVERIRELNFYREGDRTHFGQLLAGCRIQACWDEVQCGSELEARRAAAAAFNAGSRWRKRGLAMTPVKFGIAFTTQFLNQGGALVHVYTDGTVLVTHGGVEMGQGLHTKVAMVAASCLGVPLASVYIAETATDKVPNSSPTAASASSDLYGGAVADACAQINGRLAPLRAKMAGAAWAELVAAAHLSRVDLSAHGFHATPDITGFGGDKPFNYFAYGAACSEVELDVLTGDSRCLRTDICMDVGRSVNPAIDVGQVEGGFVQGLGWLTLEELVWGDAAHPWVRPGTLHTRGPGTYKIPTANDIPLDMRVTLLAGAPNERLPLVHSSKAVGEPPFFLGASVFFALKEAVYAARKDAGLEGWFQLEAPATPERLRLACADHLTAPFAGPDMVPKLSC